MYDIIYSNQALKDLKKIPRNYTSTILSKIEALALDPHAKNNSVTRLKGDKVFRLRVGDYRVVYEIYDSELVIDIVKVQPRGGVYD
jgi:mRNA interferase RelE/StbE